MKTLNEYINEYLGTQPLYLDKMFYLEFAAKVEELSWKFKDEEIKHAYKDVRDTIMYEYDKTSEIIEETNDLKIEDYNKIMELHRDTINALKAVGLIDDKQKEEARYPLVYDLKNAIANKVAINDYSLEDKLPVLNKELEKLPLTNEFNLTGTFLENNLLDPFPSFLFRYDCEYDGYHLQEFQTVLDKDGSLAKELSQLNLDNINQKELTDKYLDYKELSNSLEMKYSLAETKEDEYLEVKPWIDVVNKELKELPDTNELSLKEVILEKSKYIIDNDIKVVFGNNEKETSYYITDYNKDDIIQAIKCMDLENIINIAKEDCDRYLLEDYPQIENFKEI